MNTEQSYEHQYFVTWTLSRSMYDSEEGTNDEERKTIIYPFNPQTSYYMY